jgi:hypothetical protein
VGVGNADIRNKGGLPVMGGRGMADLPYISLTFLNTCSIGGPIILNLT